MVVRNFFTFYILPDRTRGGKAQNTGILGHFGLWHLKKSQARAENGKPQFPGARGPESEKKSYHAIQDGCPQLFYILRFGRPDPNRKILVFGALLAWGIPSALREITGRKQKNRQKNTISRS